MNNKPFMPEKEMLSDALSTQKLVTANYNTLPTNVRVKSSVTTQ